MAKRWKKEDLTYLKKYAEGKRVSELADRFNTDAASVRAQLLELGVTAIDSVPEHRIENDPLIGDYTKGLAALQKGNWATAVKTFQKVLAESDQPELAERTRRYLAIAEHKAGGTDDGLDKEDPFLVAVFHRNNGNLDEALDISTRGGRAGKDPRFALLAAGICAVKGEIETAASHLETALELDPRNRSYARQDSDFSEMRLDPEYQELF